MIRVLLVDDHALVRHGLRTIISTDEIEVVGEADNGTDALALVRATRPDVVLMDVQMPGIDGIEATRLILAEPEPPAVVILTMFDLDQYVYEALKVGASGFLLKNDPPEGLVDGVLRAARGDALLAPAVTRRLIETYVDRPPPGGSSAVLASLTEREIDVLREIGRGLSNAEIATTLFVAEATVRTHINRIFTKLHVRDRAQAVVIAYETGLVRPGDSA